MGQFLAIGLIVKCGSSKKDLKAYNITEKEFISELKNKLHFDPTIYDFLKTDENYLFNLQSTILENQLLPFLEKFYPLIYLGRNKDYIETIKMLKRTKPSEWLQLSEQKSREEFQLDNYGEYEYLYFDKPFNPCAKIFSTAIMLSLEGKIIMEEYGRQFNFFRYCIQDTFSEFPIAKAIRVYITG